MSGNQGRGRRVRLSRRTDEREFPSVNKAADYIGVNTSSLRDALEEGRPCLGWTCAYVEQQEGAHV